MQVTPGGKSLKLPEATDGRLAFARKMDQNTNGYDWTSPCSDCISCWTENFWKCAELLHILCMQKFIVNWECGTCMCVQTWALHGRFGIFVNLDSHTDSMRVKSQYCTNAWAHSRPNKSSRMAMDEERKLYANPVNLVSYLIPLQVFFQKLRFISLYLCVLNVYVIYIYT